MKKLLLGCAVLALATSAAYAQSTGSIDFENEIVVTGSTAKSVSGVSIPQTARTKAVLDSTFIQHTVPGQSINDTINMLPGVSFQNNDPFGSAGGTLSIRGFDGSRISETFDGIPLNDTGNYAIYSSQQLDPELIDQVNVNLGTTDIDSPTAAASGSTVNYRTRDPSDDFHVRVQGTAGDFDFFRLFGAVDTGVFTSFGTKAFFAASKSTNDAVYGHRGKINKEQFNAKIYQPIGDSGDFISVAGHYNKSRNGFFGSLPLRLDANRIVGSDASNRFPRNGDERDYTIARCEVAKPTPGTAGVANSCGATFDERFNPSNTGNIRINSRFTLSDKLTLTVDPSYQYVLANGGGTVVANEKLFALNATTNIPGYINGAPFVGADINGDGDALDTVRVSAPSTTQTHRFGVIANLIYQFSDTQSVRLNYSLDHGRHRQTGEVGLLEVNGEAVNFFPRDNPVADVSGATLQKRDRLSYAVLQQVSGEYSGRFFDKLTVTAGIRAPFFSRKLHQHCFTTSAAGFVDCFGSGADPAAVAAYAAAKPYSVSAAGVPGGSLPPEDRTFKYNKILPALGAVYAVTPKIAVHANYSKGLQVPGTDNLYNNFYYPLSNPASKPAPETTDNFDVGLRYRSGRLQAELAAWYTRFNNRLAQAYDPIVDKSVYTNLGKVNRYGFDGSIAYQPIKEITVYAFGSYLKSKIKDNVAAGGGSTYECSGADIANALDRANCYFTKGKRESYQPVYTAGGRIEASWGPITVGFEGKRTGRRYLNDQNIPVIACSSGGTTASGVCTIPGNTQQVFGAFEKGYTLFNLDARFSLDEVLHRPGTYLQLNVFNLFDKFYVGGSTTTAQLSPSAITFAQIGAPRAITGTLNIAF